MTDTEIFLNAVKKARENGCDIPDVVAIASADGIMGSMLADDIVNPIIYSHGFAKTFWKDINPVTVKVVNADGSSVELQYEGWQYWLSQLVIADDKFELLAHFLIGE